MINWTFFTTIHFIKMTLPLNKCNEVTINTIRNLGLSLMNCLFMLLLEIFTLLKNLSDLLSSLIFRFISKFYKVRIFFYKLFLFSHFIHNYMKNGNSPASIISILFHKE